MKQKTIAYLMIYAAPLLPAAGLLLANYIY